MIAVLYRYGSDIFERRTGMLAAMMMGTSAYVILHVHDFRMYPMLLLLAVSHCWLYWRLENGKSSSRLIWCLFVASAVALFYTHPFSIFLFAGLGFYHLLIVRKSRQWLLIATGWAIAGLSFLPYLPSLMAGVQNAAEQLKEVESAAGGAELVTAFGLLLSNGSPPLLLLLAVPLLVGIIRKRDRATLKFMLIPLAMLSAILLLNEVMYSIPISRMRYFLILWFPAVLLLARGISLMPRWIWVASLCVLLWAVAGFQFYRSMEILPYIGGMAKIRNYPPLQDYVYHLQGKVRSEDFLFGFAVDHYLNHDHKHGKSVSDFYTQLHLGIDGAFVRRGAYGEWLANDMKRLIDSRPYLLFAYDPQNPPRALERAVYELQTKYRSCDILVDIPTLYVQRYVLSMLDCDRQYAPIEYDNGITLVDRFAESDAESNILKILTGWEVPDEQMLYEYNVSFQIIAGDWRKYGQQIDRYLYDNLLEWSVIELSTSGVPPGDYRLMIILYHRESVKNVSGVDVTTGESGTIFPTLSFTIKEDAHSPVQLHCFCPY